MDAIFNKTMTRNEVKHLTRQELGEQIVGLTKTLYHVSFSLLRNEADREDAVQSAIEKAWRKAGSLKDPEKLKPWLIRILVNECYALLRSKQREVPMQLPLTEVWLPDEENLMLKDALLQLSEDLRLPIVLHYLEGMPVKDIARALKRPTNTILTRLHRGRKQLREYMNEVDFNEEY